MSENLLFNYKKNKLTFSLKYAEEIEPEQIPNRARQKISQQFILDISTFPVLDEIVSSAKESGRETTLFIPDTIKKVLSSKKYFPYFEKLVKSWTRKKVDFKLLRKIITDTKKGHVKIKYITRKDVDDDVYLYCYKEISQKNLEVRFSPPFNLLGDAIGKIIGFSKKKKMEILMHGKSLLTKIQNKISLFLISAKEFPGDKKKFFQERLPLLKHDNVKWYVSIVIASSSLALGSVELAAAGIGISGMVFVAIDP